MSEPRSPGSNPGRVSAARKGPVVQGEGVGFPQAHTSPPSADYVCVIEVEATRLRRNRIGTPTHVVLSVQSPNGTGHGWGLGGHTTLGTTCVYRNVLTRLDADEIRRLLDEAFPQIDRSGAES